MNGVEHGVYKSYMEIYKHSLFKYYRRDNANQREYNPAEDTLFKVMSGLYLICTVHTIRFYCYYINCTTYHNKIS